MSAVSFTQAQAKVLDRYGVDVEERFIDVPVIDGQAHVLVTGEGPEIVMVTGIGTPAAMWAPLMAQLAGFTLHAVDLPGYGLTDAKPDMADNFRSTTVRFLAEVVDGLELEQPAFVANSLGSLWASWFAIDRPTRVGRLVHVGCPALALETSALLPMRMLSVRPLGRLIMKMQPPSARQVRQLSKMVNQHPLPASIGDLLLSTEQRPGFESTFLATLRALLRLRGARPEMRLTAEQLSQIDHRSLLVFGTNDPFGATTVGERMVEALRHAQLHVVDGGHTPWLDHPKQIGRLISTFLNDNSATTTKGTS